jgi:hypothetical protein
MTITLRAGVVSSGIQQNGTEFLTVDSSNNVSLTNNLAVTGTLTATGKLAASSLPAGCVLQVKNFQTGTYATGTTLLPFDNTIPQITEGNQYLSLAITPISATSKLLIQVNIVMSSSALNFCTAALFQDSTANAIAASSVYASVATGIVIPSFNYFMTSGTTSATTFTVRAGTNNAGTTTVNGQSGGQSFGGVCSSSITITEIAA